ncbi:MAG: hypothetical protein VW547_10120, partial [Alphaproteobacteria bacterium]
MPLPFEQLNGIQEVVGSIPIGSTKTKGLADRRAFFLWATRCARVLQTGTNENEGAPEPMSSLIDALRDIVVANRILAHEDVV